MLTMTIDEIVLACRDLGASDIHIVCGLPVKCRVDGSVRSLNDNVLTHDDCELIARSLAGEDYEKIASIGELDFARSFADDIRTRINVFRQQGSVSCAIRILRGNIPHIEDLGLPPAVGKMPSFRSGLILVTGETGSGKSTTLAAVIQRINETRDAHIITLEDPIEYVYTPQRCIINQREIGKDTNSYTDGLRAILREDPDIILIGEMRDLDTIEAALTAAETGHLVFATLHTNSAAESIDRIVDVFPSGRQQQVRLQLSTTLRMVLSQQLLPLKEKGRAAACEVMVVNSAIKNLISEGNTHQIDSFITMGAKDGSITMDNAIKAMLEAHRITLETAESFARNKDALTRGGTDSHMKPNEGAYAQTRRPMI